MGRVEIAVRVPREVALLNGLERYGEATLTPTEEQLRSLSREERRILIRFLVDESAGEEQRRLRIRTAPVSWEGVIEAIRHMVSCQEQAQQEADEGVETQQARESQACAAALVLRNLVPQADGLSDRDFVEHAVLALMEEVRDTISMSLKIDDDHIRIVSVDSPEWRRMSLTVREEYTLEAARILGEVKKEMKQVIPIDQDALFRMESMVVRVRQKSKEDGIARRPVTHVVGMLHCAACCSIALLVRAEPQAVGVSG
jgi:hypothetical protein